ncbi:MAG: outer membrane receptor for ferrienterochelin and colicins [Candidatus Endobugula sp.]|jgi:outer membrane receptor for ferrienterochelin and colicins
MIIIIIRISSVEYWLPPKYIAVMLMHELSKRSLLMLLSHKNIVALMLGSSLLTAQLSFAGEVYEMSKVVVSAKAPVDATKFAGSVTVIDAADIRASGASTVTEVLESVSGVQLVVTGNNSTKAPQLRGQATDQVLVLVNGKRLPNTDRNLPFAPAYRYNWVPVANIARIEVIRGPGSSLYGADALAGVINIITREAESEWHGNLSLYTKQADGNAGGDEEGVSVAASGALGESMDLSLAAETTHVDAIFDDANALTLKSEKETKNFQADIGIDLSENDRLQVGVLYGDEEGRDIDNGFSGVNTTESDVQRRRSSIDYSTKLGSFAANVGLASSNADVIEGTSVWKIDEKNVIFDMQGQLTQQQYLSAGVTYRKEAADRNDSVVFSDSINAATLFLQDVINVGDDNTLTLGVAYDNHSKYDNEVSPKVNWFSQLSPAWGFKAGYGESYLAPSLREGSAAYIVSAGPTRTYIGNDELQPETSKTVELGFTFSDESTIGSITVFKTKTEDLIGLTDTVDNSGFFPVTTAEYNNIDEALIQGVETEWAFYSDSKDTKVNLSYTYLDTEDRSAANVGKELTDRSKHSAKINLRHELPKWGVHLYGGVRYIGKQYTDAANTAEIDAYSVADIGIAKTLFSDVQLRFGIQNIGNKRVIDTGSTELLQESRAYKFTLSSQF